MEEHKPILFDTGVAFICEGHTIIIHLPDMKDVEYGIYNRIMTTDEIKNILEPTPRYGQWGSEEGLKRKQFFDLAKEILPREAYLEFVHLHGGLS